MISLQPREHFAIVRVLGDHTDSTTYYVRATVRDAITGVTLETLALNDLGSRRFTYNYQVPADSSGLGKYIDITTEVFTDSGYTTKASTYSDENETYLVWDRISGMKRGGGDAPAIDYKKIAKIMSDCMKGMEMPNMDLEPVLKALQSLQTAVDSIEVPEAEKVELEPVMAKMEEIIGKIKKSEVAIIDEVQAKEIPEQKETDLSPVIDAFKNSFPSQMVEKATALVEQFGNTMNVDTLGKVKEDLKTIVDFMSMFISKNTEIKSLAPEPVPPKKPSSLRS